MRFKKVENSKKFWYNIFVKSGAVIVAFSVAMGLVLYSGINRQSAVLVSVKPYSQCNKIIIDAGHGGLTNTIH